MRKLWLGLAAASLAGCGGGGSGGAPSGNSPTDPGESPNEPELAAPEDVTLTAGHGSVTVVWSEVPNAEGHHIYYAEDPDLTPDDYAAYEGGVWLQNVSSPHTVTGLTHGATYYFIVTAFADGEEGVPSATKAVTLPDRIANAASGMLNDSGFDRCADAVDLALDCPHPSYPGQDGDWGRDAAARRGALSKQGAGAAGFDFTKVSHAGIALPPDAALGSNEADWACTLDHVTGLLWEIRPDAPGTARHRGHTYSWYLPDAERNGGQAGVPNGGVCSGSACDTQAYVDAVNDEGLCGFDDWRMPTAAELASIVHHGRVSPAVDIDYFPDVPSSDPLYWTATAFAPDANIAWSIDFTDGQLVNPAKNYAAHVRLVRADD
ncbi:MAG TPA: DUF1566 domain-containing protein [Gammaproteobacteria bacterium]